MTMTIEMTPEVETGLERKARRCGQPLYDYVFHVLQREAAQEEKGLLPEREPDIEQAADLSPLAAFLNLARQLDPIIQSGTRGPANAVDAIETNREERMRAIDPRS